MKHKHNIYFILILLIIISPLVHSKTSLFGMSVPKVLYFWTIVDFMFLISLFRMKYEGIILQKSIINLLLGVNLLIMLVSSFLSDNFQIGFLSTFDRMDGILNYIHFIVFIIIISSIKYSEKQWALMAYLSCFVALIITIYGKIEASRFVDGRMQSTLSNPLFVTIYLLFHFYISLYLVYKNLISKKYLLVFVFSIFNIIFLYGILYTKSRIGLIALFTGVLIGLLIILFKIEKNRKVYLSLFSLLIITVFVLYFYRFHTAIYSHQALGRILNINSNDESILSRIDLWKVVISGMTEKPLLGWGNGHFIDFFVKYYQPQMYDKGFWYDKPHNIFLEKIVENGFTGLIGYVVLIGSIFYFLWKKTTFNLIEKGIISGSLISYIVYLFAVFDSHSSLLMFSIFVIYIQQYSVNNPVFIKFSSLKIINNSVLLFGCIVVAATLYSGVYRSIDTIKNWNKAYNSKEIQALVNNYKHAYNHAVIGKNDIAIDFALKKEAVSISNFNGEVNQVYYFEVENVLNDALRFQAKNPILLTQLGFVQSANQKNNQAIKTYQKLREIAPKRQVNLMDLGSFYLQTKQYDKADEIYDYTYQLNKDYKMPLLLRAYVKALKKEKFEADKIIRQLPTELIVEKPEVVLDIYALNNDFQACFDLFMNNKEMIKFKPETYYYWLKAAYLNQNEEQIFVALYGFERHYLADGNYKDEVKKLTKLIQTRKETPEAIFNYFNFRFVKN